MTTLPQTTPVRLPRAARSSPLTVPGGGPAGGGGGGAGVQMSAGDVWRVIRANVWLIVVLVVLSAVGGYVLNNYLAKYHSVYASSGYIRIRPLQPIDPLRGTAALDAGSLDIAQATQTQMIRSDELLDSILKQADNPIRQTNWWLVECGADPRRAREYMSEHLSVEPQMGSELIKVAVTTATKADAPVLVTAVCDQAIQKQKSENEEKDAADRKRIADLKGLNFRNKIATDREVQMLGDELSRGGGDPRDGHGPKDAELNHEIERNIGLNSDKVTADNMYKATQAQLERGETPGRVQTMVDQDRDVIQYKSELDSLDVSIALDAHGVNSPQYQQMSKQREVFQNKLTNIQAERGAQFSRNLLAELDAQRTNDSQQLDASNVHVADLKQSIAELGSKYTNYQILREDQAGYRRQDDEFRNALMQLDEKVQMADFGSLAWAVHPLEPGAPSSPVLYRTLMGAVASGLALALGIAFLRELTDTTVRSPRDVIRVGQMPILGMVPHEADDPQTSGARLPLVIFEAPGSAMAEQLRQVRTRLQHAASLDTTRTILVTSAAPGDGKSTIATNLAAGLALNGRRILLVDANFRRPELHRIFGIGNEVGFSDVLDDVNAFAAAVRETSVPNLSVLPSGPRPNNSTELLESQLLVDAIERALEEYDHVVFDSGPMLIVSESVALAPRVDGVVTVVRARSSSRGVLLRMRDVLRQVKAEHLGVVLNGVRTQAGGYYGRSIKSYYDYQNPA